MRNTMDGYIAAIAFYLLMTMNLMAADEMSEECPLVNFVARSAWGSFFPRGGDEMRSHPLYHVIISNTVSDMCETSYFCIRQVRTLQRNAVEMHGFSDIPYNFVIGGDGKVYEGRGWERVAAHTRGFNSKSIGIGVIGKFSEEEPTPQMLKATKELIDCGVKLGYLSRRRKIHGHRDIACDSESPGHNFYEKMKQWPGYAGRNRIQGAPTCS